MPELYAATPPPDWLSMIFSDVMTRDLRLETPKTLMVCDVSRACVYAPSIRPIYVKIIDEDQEAGDAARCGRLIVSMHGARDAAFN